MKTEQALPAETDVLVSAAPVCVIGGILRNGGHYVMGQYCELPNVLVCTQGSRYTTRQHDCPHPSCELYQTGELTVKPAERPPENTDFSGVNF